VKVGGEKIKNNQAFASDDNWLKTLTISIRNISQKRILFASIDLVFYPPPGSGGGIAIDQIDYGNRALLIRPPSVDDKLGGIAPNQEVDAQLNAIGYDRVKELLTTVGYRDIHNVKIKIGRVIFADNTSWYGDDFRRDPTDPRGWINSESSAQAKSPTSIRSPRISMARSQASTDSTSLSHISNFGLDSSQNAGAVGLQALILRASYVRTAPPASDCYRKSWSGNVVCYWGMQCTTQKDLTDTVPGSYQFTPVSAMCSDVMGDYCGMGSTSIGVPCSFGGGGGGGGGRGGHEGNGGGYDGNGSCSGDFDCDFGYHCGDMFMCEEDFID